MEIDAQKLHTLAVDLQAAKVQKDLAAKAVKDAVDKRGLAEKQHRLALEDLKKSSAAGFIKLHQDHEAAIAAAARADGEFETKREALHQFINPPAAETR